jgi:hypothetical protein
MADRDQLSGFSSEESGAYGATWCKTTLPKPDGRLLVTNASPFLSMMNAMLWPKST